jgi:hypothetical protein
MKKTRKELSLEIINKYGYTVREYNHFGCDVIIHINNDYAKRLLVKELRKASKRQLLQVLNASDCKLEIAYFRWNGNKPRLLITFKPKKTINVLNFNYYFCV